MSNEGSMCCCELYHHLLPTGPINTNLSHITNYFWRTQITDILQLVSNSVVSSSSFSFFLSICAFVSHQF